MCAFGGRLGDVVLQGGNLGALRGRVADRRRVCGTDDADLECLGDRAAQLFTQLGDLVVSFPINVLEMSLRRIDLVGHGVVRSFACFQEVCE
ncbi:hypothetical protein [Mycolicibacterium houstonense]|uniref:hypothetical protein n=1 Tax=Mycolicibacterium houstonense TaxID=146021 RepID=UPI003F9D2D13